jgi:hypothetical protein
MSLSQIAETYEKEVDELPQLHYELGGGVARNRSGLVYENLIKRTCESLALEPKKNDYKKTEEVNGSCLSNLQVDWHVYSEGTMCKAVESKAYLDACYLKRAVMDFIELDNSPEVPNEVEYAIVAGQNACGNDALNYYQAFFAKMTGKKVHIFFLNPARKRSSARAIYNEAARKDFTLDSKVYTKFAEFLTSR